ncbi:UNVERIFIED_CONTAM: Retrovirus-related Pol polyprotein from transposon [Sesamum radiatum]|uniref:Retrovirus-related Pol polyprotein from transposon n=1 Tax=Sesamum radiatum TaxID=300843 RepID=A0AAW2L411_SESRA
MRIGFRDLNKACPKDFYPLPRIDQLVDSTSGCELLSMMDAWQGYHQIMLAPENHKRVGFITSEGTFYYVAMLFGIKNTGATYQRLVDKIFRHQLGKNMEVYVDDMLVKSKENEECQRAFEELKEYLAKLPLLVKPSPGKTLYLYISSTSQAVSTVLVREEDGTQTPIDIVSKVLIGAESRYPHIEKMALALVVTARKLRPYFLSYPVGVRTNTPLKKVLGKPKASGQLVEWAIELSEYGISYLPQTTIKPQALANFVSEMTRTTQEEVFQERPWLLHVDGSSTTQGSGAGVVITTPEGEDMELEIKFDFKAFNNKAEYEGLVLGMRITRDAGALHLLAYSDSQLIVKQVSGEYEAKEESMV